MGFDSHTWSRVYRNYKITNSTPERIGFYHYCPASPIALVVTSGCNLFCSFCPEFRIVYSPWVIKEANKYTLMTEILNFVENHGVHAVALYCNSALDLELISDLKRFSNIIAVTNGFISKDSLVSYISNLDAILLRLIGFSESSYARMTPFPDAYSYARELIIEANFRGKLLEVEFYIIPGVTSENEFVNFLRFIGLVNKNIPLHIKRFRRGFVELERRPTRTEDIVRYYNIAKQFLNYVYADIWISPYCDTFCPNGHLQIKRFGWKVRKINLKGDACSVCGERIPIKITKRL
ncbi:MAG: hypothetical protein QXH55_04745 [Candidatus Korarchaeota archaeon]|nr:hypothetical protein [Thermoproteota archaeon]MCR8463254.1 hypothetical protein [Thermoproteota archaeon]MCR8470472.1 hypothetical protein [Thermoproteota archaeon]MCR8471489.1 hypothetical protein [Thermoproteota archaeon]MCR8473376.1 hypothetical protein [Thermoproteota archaeon]